ncbi:SUMF1/EgtB/PvdO family nonheme iron enzyme [candidate division KSB1 bacterium]
MKNLTILLFIVSFTGIMCSEDSPTEPEITGTVKGYVYETGTTTPISGVEVSIGSTSDTTSSNGYYELTSIPVSSQTLAASAFSYGNYSQTITVQEGLNEYNIELAALFQPIIDMVSIPGGTFQMGDLNGVGNPDERPVHTVMLDAFSMSTYEITNTQYCAFLNNVGRHTDGEQTWLDIYSHYSECQIIQITENNEVYTPVPGEENAGIVNGVYTPESGKENYPVVEVNWYGAKAFCDWLTTKTGDTYRLPTEAEWEYACRAGSTTEWCFGDDESQLTNYAWYKEHSGKTVHPVGQKLPNSWGLYDMHGNVAEWCDDLYGESYYHECYNSGTVTNPVGPSPRFGHSRVIRGGGYDSFSSYVRSADRHYYSPDGIVNLTFRCVRTY